MTQSIEPVSGETDAQRALDLLQAHDDRDNRLHDLLEEIREQIRLEVPVEHRPQSLFTNIQNAVYAMRGRTRLMDDAAITAPLSSIAAAPVNQGAYDALRDLEDACEALAATRTQATYLSMIDNDMATVALERLDKARLVAREHLRTLSAAHGEAVEPHGWVYRSGYDGSMNFVAADKWANIGEDFRARHPEAKALYLSPASLPLSADETEMTWRDLALQFDGHRMEALSILRWIERNGFNPEVDDRIETFLAAPPLSGEAVLADRIAALNLSTPLERTLKIEVCKGQSGLALYVDDERQAGVRHNGVQETILRSDYTLSALKPIEPERISEAMVDAADRAISVIAFVIDNSSEGVNAIGQRVIKEAVDDLRTALDEHVPETVDAPQRR